MFFFLSSKISSILFGFWLFFSHTKLMNKTKVKGCDVLFLDLFFGKKRLFFLIIFHETNLLGGYCCHYRKGKMKMTHRPVKTMRTLKIICYMV